MLIAPVLTLGMHFGPMPRCEVCRIGEVCAAVFHDRGAFAVCSLCAGNILAAMTVRVAFSQIDQYDAELLA
jgi:hypothetical protein